MNGNGSTTVGKSSTSIADHGCSVNENQPLAPRNKGNGNCNSAESGIDKVQDQVWQENATNPLLPSIHSVFATAEEEELFDQQDYELNNPFDSMDICASPGINYRLRTLNNRPFLQQDGR
jgi:hypothetical protein